MHLVISYLGYNGYLFLFFSFQYGLRQDRKLPQNLRIDPEISLVRIK